MLNIYLSFHSANHHSPPRLSIKLTLKDSSAVTLKQRLDCDLCFVILHFCTVAVSDLFRIQRKKQTLEHVMQSTAFKSPLQSICTPKIGAQHRKRPPLERLSITGKWFHGNIHRNVAMPSSKIGLKQTTWKTPKVKQRQSPAEG